MNTPQLANKACPGRANSSHYSLADQAEVIRLSWQLKDAMFMDPPMKSKALDETDEEGNAVGSRGCETPQRKNGVWSQSTDNSSTIKKENTQGADPNPIFKTPPKRPSRPTVEELQVWQRVDRDKNRRHQ